MSIHIIYIPGLGDGYDGFRRFGLGIWTMFGVSAELAPMTWYNGGSFDKKYSSILKRIHHAAEKNQTVILVGESAGATMALIAASQEPAVQRVITLCGVSQPTTPIASSLRQRAPALDTAVKKLANIPKRDDLTRISLRAYIDGVVAKKYSVADGADERIVWSIGHSFTVMLCLTLYSPYMLHLAKSK